MEDLSAETCLGKSCLTCSSTESLRRLRRRIERELRLPLSLNWWPKLLTLLQLLRKNGVLTKVYLIGLLTASLLQPHPLLPQLLLQLLPLLSRCQKTGLHKLRQATGLLSQHLRLLVAIPGEVPVNGRASSIQHVMVSAKYPETWLLSI